MNRRALVVAALVVLTACGTNTRQEKQIIDGQQFLCTWTEPGVNPFGRQNDYRCEAFSKDAP